MTVYSALRNGSTLSFRTIDGKPAQTPPAGAAVLMDPRDYSVFLLDAPEVKETEMESLLRFRLRSQYPGSIESLALSYRRVATKSAGAGPRTSSILVVAINRKTLDEYRTRIDRPRLFAIESLVLQRSDSKRVLFPGFAVTVEAEPFRRIVDSDAVHADPGTPVEGEPVAAVIPRVLPRSLEEFSVARSWWGTRVSVAAALCFALASVLVFRDVRTLDRAVEAAAARHQELMREVQESTDAAARIDELETELERVPDGGLEAAAPTPYTVLSALAAVAGDDVEIRELTLRGSSIEIAGVAEAPLEFANRLSSEGSFADVALRRVQPGPEGVQRFSLAGSYRP